MNYLTTAFLVEFSVLILVNIFLKNSSSRFIYQSNRIFKRVLILIFIWQLLAIGFLRQEINDVFLFSGAGKYFRQAIDFYWIDSDHFQYPFFPLMIFFFAVFNFLTEEVLPLFTFSFYLKAGLLLPCLYYLSYLIFKKNKSGSLANARRLQLEFLTSPISFCPVIFHGQIDIVLVVLFFLSARLSVDLSIKNKFQSWLKLFFSSLVYGASIAAKTWSVIFMPTIIRFQKTLIQKCLFIVGTGFFLFINIFIYTRLVFGSSFSTVLPAPLTSRIITKFWGLPFLVSFSDTILLVFEQYKLPIFISLFTLTQFLIWLKKPSFWLSCFLTVLGVYMVIPNWAAQYLFWILPFIYLFQSHLSPGKINFFKFLGSFYLFFHYLIIVSNSQNIFLLFTLQSSLFILWMFMLIWFFDLLLVHNQIKIKV